MYYALMSANAKIVIAVRLHRADATFLKLIAKRRKTTRSELIREAIRRIMQGAA